MPTAEAESRLGDTDVTTGWRRGDAMRCVGTSEKVCERPWRASTRLTSSARILARVRGDNAVGDLNKIRIIRIGRVQARVVFEHLSRDILSGAMISYRHKGFRDTQGRTVASTAILCALLGYV
jgi:hypothetical protein